MTNSAQRMCFLFVLYLVGTYPHALSLDPCTVQFGIGGLLLQEFIILQILTVQYSQ